jgi:hypothetical protein
VDSADEVQAEEASRDGIETQDLELDFVVAPDGSWQKKDDELLDASVEKRMEPLRDGIGPLIVVARSFVCFLVVVAVTACTTSGESGPPNTQTVPPPSAVPVASDGPDQRPRCGVGSLTSPRYGSHIEPSSGLPGQTVEVFGLTFRGEDGRFFPSYRLEVWWNARVPATEVPDAQPYDDGPVILLVTVRNMDRCRFRAQYTVPDVRPGTYKIRTFVYYAGGYGWFGWHRFTVEASS